MTWTDDNADLIEGFILESREAIDSIDPLFIQAIQNIEENQPVNLEVLNGIFRLFHTMKGSAGFINLNLLVKLTHQAETLLDLYRNGTKAITRQGLQALLDACETLSQILDVIEEKGTDQDGVDISKDLECLAMLIDSDESSAVAPVAEVTPEIDFNTESVDSDFSLDLDMLSPEIVEKFVQEGLDILDSAETNLLELDKNSANEDALKGLFRDCHTFKGNCGFMSFDEMHNITHSLETIVSGFEFKTIPCSSGNINVLLGAVDQLKSWLFELIRENSCSYADYETHLDILKSLEPAEQLPPEESLEPLEGASTQTPEEVAASISAQQITDSLNKKVLLVVEDNNSIRLFIKKIIEASGYVCIDFTNAEDAISLLSLNTIEVNLCLTDINLPGMHGDEFITHVNTHYPDMPIVVVSGNNDRELLKKLLKQDVYGFLDKPIVKEEMLTLIHDSLAQSMRKKIQQATSAAPTTDSGATKKSRRDIRVDLNKLDTLIDLVGELIIAESMMTHSPDLEGLELPSFEKAAHRLHIITGELQDISMAVRMIPVSGVFKKMLRLVHDVSNKTAKPLKLKLEGEETEVDKAVVDMIADPLVHMIRNSADHGIEPPEDRLKAGKPQQGTITLSAVQRASEVLISISDDGRGLDLNKIRAKSIANGLMTESDDELSDQDIYQMIFEPGFSTAEKVSNISGRGVGMDVVKKNIEIIKGYIEINNKPGKGCEFVIHIPLTLATIEGMLVKVGNTKYTIPITAIRESIRATPDMVTTRPDGQEFVKIREIMLPVFRLYELHNIVPETTRIDEGILIVLDLPRGMVCLFVDDFLYQVQTVIKTLSGYMGRLKGISGCNILGDGDVALILDPETVLKCLPNNLAKPQSTKHNREAKHV